MVLNIVTLLPTLHHVCSIKYLFCSKQFYSSKVVYNDSTNRLTNKHRLRMLQTARLVLQLIITKISTYTIYLYVFITVKIASQSNRLSYTAQTVVTIQNLYFEILVTRLTILRSSLTSIFQLGFLGYPEWRYVNKSVDYKIMNSKQRRREKM